MERDIVTLADVHIAVTRIQKFTADVSREVFLSDQKTQSAVLYQLMLIGEAIKRLSPEFRQAHPDVLWKDYAGFRDVLIHQYDNVNFDSVWKAVSDELPQLLSRVEQILPSPPPI